MKERFIYGDPQKCIGCHHCELACSVEHEGVFSPSLSRIRIVGYEDIVLNVPVVCGNCTKMACAEACPIGAIEVSEEGYVSVNEAECIGCKQCIKACPLGAISWHPKKQVAMKCDLCNGDPTCVEACPVGAIKLMDAASASALKRREATEAMTK